MISRSFRPACGKHVGSGPGANRFPPGFGPELLPGTGLATYPKAHKPGRCQIAADADGRAAHIEIAAYPQHRGERPEHRNMITG